MNEARQTSHPKLKTQSFERCAYTVKDAEYCTITFPDAIPNKQTRELPRLEITQTNDGHKRETKRGKASHLKSNKQANISTCRTTMKGKNARVKSTCYIIKKKFFSEE